MKKVPLGGKRGEGKFALIDDEDLPMVSKHPWHLDSGGYASSYHHVAGKKRGEKGRTQSMRMHRFILNFPVNNVDHEDRDRLNNQRDNLREATPIQNKWNTTPKVGASGYIGVRQESTNVFSARLNSGPVGFYRTALEAAQARDIAAISERGSFAVLNFKIEDLPESVDPLPPRNLGERTSKVVGVSYAAKQKRKDKWRVVVAKRHIGWFFSEELAIKAKEDYANQISD